MRDRSVDRNSSVVLYRNYSLTTVVKVFTNELTYTGDNMVGEYRIETAGGRQR